MMTPYRDESAAKLAFAFHQLNAQLFNSQNIVVPGISEELKTAIATEVRMQMVPVVNEMVHEVVDGVRSVMSEMVTPLYGELRALRNCTSMENASLYTAARRGIYGNESSCSLSNMQNTQGTKVENCDESPACSSSINCSQVYGENNFSSKSQGEYAGAPREPRAQASTSDCAAFSFIYYNTACIIPVATLLDPGNNAFICQKVPKIYLGKEGGKISFLVDMKTVRLRDLRSDNLGYWTSRFAAHMKTRKYFVKDGQITGRIRQFGGRVCHLLQDYDYILHKQYYCHGNTIGPAAIRKNIWYLTSKANSEKVVGCALISYEIDDNATVKISKLRKSELNAMDVKEEMPTEEMDVNIQRAAFVDVTLNCVSQ